MVSIAGLGSPGDTVFPTDGDGSSGAHAQVIALMPGHEMPVGLERSAIIASLAQSPNRITEEQLLNISSSIDLERAAAKNGWNIDEIRQIATLKGFGDVIERIEAGVEEIQLAHVLRQEKDLTAGPLTANPEEFANLDGEEAASSLPRDPNAKPTLQASATTAPGIKPLASGTSAVDTFDPTADAESKGNQFNDTLNQDVALVTMLKAPAADTASFVFTMRDELTAAREQDAEQPGDSMGPSRQSPATVTLSPKALGEAGAMFNPAVAAALGDMSWSTLLGNNQDMGGTTAALAYNNTLTGGSVPNLGSAGPSTEADAPSTFA